MTREVFQQKQDKMIKCIHIPDQTFKTQEELFHALKANETIIIDRKKSLVYNSSISTIKGRVPLVMMPEIEESETTKGIGFRTKENYMYPVVSTTNYMDSHDDVHWENSMNKTAKDQQGKVYFCTDHNLTSAGIVVPKSKIEMFVRSIPWTLVGKSYEGNTNALIFGFDKKDIINPTAKILLDTEKDIECSIRMIYGKVVLAMNSKHKDHVDNLAYYESNIGRIANRERAEKLGYFFGVEELWIRGEASMVLGGGSNDATAIYEAKEGNEHNVTCQGCNAQFDYLKQPEAGMGYVKCPECSLPVTQEAGQTTSSKIEPLKDTRPAKTSLKKRILLINKKEN